MTESAQHTAMIGRVIASQFKVSRKLGSGGMGSVYLAEQVDIEREVVVKMMHPELTAGSTEAPERFKREARAVARLNHPNIVQVYVFGQTDDLQLYLAMEYIDGRTLSDEVKEKKAMPVPRVLRIMDQVCSALIEAHGSGLVHRDLKPDNIMLTDRHGNPDYVKVLDFGIAKMLGNDTGEQDLTKTGTTFGTPRYMSPEQARGLPVDTRADIYSLGVMLYQMLTGEHPYQATDALTFIMKHVTEPIGLPSERRPNHGIAPRVDALVQQCVEKDPKDRFQSAADLQRAIRTALRDFPESQRGFPTPGVGNVASVSAPPAPTMAMPTRPSSRLWLWILIGVLALGGGSVGVYFAVRDSDGDRKVRRADADADEESGSKIPRRRGRKSKDRVATNTDTPTVAPINTDDPSKAVIEAPEPVVEAPKPPVDDTPIPEAGPDIEGLPAPIKTQLSASTPQALVLTTDLEPIEALAFYRHHMAKKWGTLKGIAGGFEVTNPKAPVTYVMVQRDSLGSRIILTRNALAAPPPPIDSTALVLGAAVYPDARVSLRTETTVGLVTRDPLEKVILFYRQQYGLKEGINVTGTNDGNGRPMLIISRSQAPVEFRTITVMTDPQTPKGGRVQIYIIK